MAATNRPAPYSRLPGNLDPDTDDHIGGLASSPAALSVQ
jgi:hypothetical protein